jgi:hypothetical protein
MWWLFPSFGVIAIMANSDTVPAKGSEGRIAGAVGSGSGTVAAWSVRLLVSWLRRSDYGLRN